VLQKLNAICSRVHDFGDVTAKANIDLSPTELSRIAAEEEQCQHLKTIYSNCKALSRCTSEALKQNLLPFIIGGDHSLSIGSSAAICQHYAQAKTKVGLIWIDTHADFNTPTTSPSKRIFGMTTAVLSGHVPGLLSSLQNPAPAIAEKNIAYIGLRDLDQGERQRLKDSGSFVSTIKDIDIHGIAAVVKGAMEAALDGTTGFIVSFDIDVCDSNLMPGTSTPSRGGLTFREAHCALEMLHESGKLLAFELAELNPLLDKNFQTVDIAISFIESAAGKTIF
jgi:arginase